MFYGFEDSCFAKRNKGKSFLLIFSTLHFNFTGVQLSGLYT